MRVSLPSTSIELGTDEFRQRQMRARRSGNPAWLWPEVSADSWAEAAAQIGAATSAVLRSEPAVLGACDPAAMSLAGYTSGVGPLLGWWLENRLLSASPEIGDLFRLHLEHGRVRAQRMEARSRETVDRLAQRDVPTIILKGGHTAHLYFPDPATRPASDLDLLVPSSHIGAAETVLTQAGLRCASRKPRESAWTQPGTGSEPRSLWLVHADDPWPVDLHNSLDFSACPGATPVRLDAAGPFQNPEPWPVHPAAGVLRQPLLLLHLAVHASGGLHSLTLLRMVEIGLIVRQDSANGRLSWDEFLAMAERTNGLGAAYPALAMCEKLAPGTIPSKVLGRSAERAPPRVRAIVEKLEPASAHRVNRASIAEHFMWVSGFSGWMRQLKFDLAPEAAPTQSIREIYEARAYRLLRGRISR